MLDVRRAEFEKLTGEFWDAFERKQKIIESLRLCRQRLMEFIAGEEEGLSTRQRQVLNLLAGGRSDKEIAKRLGISRSAVKHHCSAVYRKLGISGRTELLNF